MDQHSEIHELDLNPVLVYEEGFKVVDARLIQGEPIVHSRLTDLSPSRMESLESVFNPKSVAVIGASLFVDRPFCKYACPYGAVLGVFNLFRIFKIKRNAPTCIDCKACDRACPMNIPVSTSGVVRDHQCISCMVCTSEKACPIANTVALTTGKMGQKTETDAKAS